MLLITVPEARGNLFLTSFFSFFSILLIFPFFLLEREGRGECKKWDRVRGAKNNCLFSLDLTEERWGRSEK